MNLIYKLLKGLYFDPTLYNFSGYEICLNLFIELSKFYIFSDFFAVPLCLPIVIFYLIYFIFFEILSLDIAVYILFLRFVFYYSSLYFLSLIFNRTLSSLLILSLFKNLGCQVFVFILVDFLLDYIY